MNILLITNYSTSLIKPFLNTSHNYIIPGFQNHLDLILKEDFDKESIDIVFVHFSSLEYETNYLESNGTLDYCNDLGFILDYFKGTKAIFLIPYMDFIKDLVFNIQASKHLTSIEARIIKFNNYLKTIIEQNENTYGLSMDEGSSLDIFDYDLYNLSGMPFSMSFISKVCEELNRFIALSNGGGIKAIITDLDNTLWKGILGDDGIEGIKCTQTDGGHLFYIYQRYLKKLNQRGILLAISSKNQEELVLKALKNDKTNLEIEDFTIIKANWKSKSENIKEIIQKLNINSSSVLFIDDNPTEIELVKNTFPNIETLNFKNPKELISGLRRRSWFQYLQLTKEDSLRSESIKSNILREQDLIKSTNYEDFLRSLKLEIELKKFSESNKKRISQLSKKTNQFIMCSNRWSEQEVVEISKSENLSLDISVKDKYSDYGTVALFSAVIDKKKLVIQNWIMSCRVFSKDIEYETLNYVMKECKKRNVDELEIKFQETDRNGPALEFINNAGFMLDVGKNSYILLVKDFKPKQTSIKIVTK